MLLEYAGEVASLDENLALLRLGQKQAEVGGVAGADWLARLTDQEMLRLCRARRRNVYGHEWKLQGSDGKSAVRVPRFCTGSAKQSCETSLDMAALFCPCCSVGEPKQV